VPFFLPYPPISLTGQKGQKGGEVRTRETREGRLRNVLTSQSLQHLELQELRGEEVGRGKKKGEKSALNLKERGEGTIRITSFTLFLKRCCPNKGGQDKEKNK